MTIKTLAMWKMEKNFRAHIEKKYTRMPYLHYGIEFWIHRLRQEIEELTEAYLTDDIERIREELADISNLTDFAFETTYQNPSLKEPWGIKGLDQLFKHNKELKKQ